MYLPDGIELPAGQEYLGLYARRPLRKADLRRFLEDATLDVAAMDSAQSDQWNRHLQRALTRPDDYWLSVLQWQFGYAANLMTSPNEENLLPDEQPRDVPRDPQALFEPWLHGLRQCQYAIGELRRQLHAAHRAQPAGATRELSPLAADWLKWLPQPATAEAPPGVPRFPGFAEGMQAAIAAVLRGNKHIT